MSLNTFQSHGLSAVALLVAAVVSLPTHAEPVRQHGAHVHGEATGNLSLDDERLRLELTIPGVNLVGFEHPPRDEAQSAALSATLEHLNAATWVRTHGAGRCEVVSVNAHTHGFSGDEATDEHDHSTESRHDDPDHHQHEHEHEHRHSGHEHHHREGHDHSAHDHAHHGHHGGDDHHGHDHDHAEFHLVMTWDCQRPGALDWIDIDLFSDYPGNERIVIDVLTDRTASRERLQPNRIRVNL